MRAIEVETTRGRKLVKFRQTAAIDQEFGVRERGDRRLYHVSNEAGITLFESRPSTIFPSLGAVVWAISKSHLANYLLPRECPRVTFVATSRTSGADRQRFEISGDRRIVVIEQSWWARVITARVYVYEMPSAPFDLYDSDAGYWIAKESVPPLSIVAVDHLPAALAAQNAELRVVDKLWDLHDEVTASTLSFSIIRMRNASK